MFQIAVSSGSSADIPALGYSPFTKTPKKEGEGMLNIHDAARDGDTVTVRTLLSTAGALSLINTQDAAAWGHGAAPSTMSVAEAEALFMARLTCRR